MLNIKEKLNQLLNSVIIKFNCLKYDLMFVVISDSQLIDNSFNY